MRVTFPVVLYLLAAIMALTVIGTPFVYDTHNFGDTQFMLGAAWRIAAGYTPALDFGYFYGRVASGMIALAFDLFGVSVKAFDYAMALFFVLGVLVVALLAFGRLSRLGVATLVLALAVLFFTRHPLEISTAPTEIVSAHSFSYNRIGLGLLMLCGLFVGLPARPGRAASLEIMAGFVVGGLCFVAALVKPTFIVLTPAVLAGLALQRRWPDLAAVVAGFLLFSLVLDPGFARCRAAFDYAVSSVAARSDGTLGALLRKSVLVALAQPMAALAVLWAGGLIWRATALSRPALLGGALVIAAGFGMAATMGGGNQLGQLALPGWIMGLTVLAELARRHLTDRVPLIETLSLILSLSFALPHAANLAASTAEGFARRGAITADAGAIPQGPMAPYFSLPTDQGQNGGLSQYAVLVDGMEALATLGDMSDRGIVADNAVSFEFPLLARVVPEYPLWPRLEAPELADRGPLPASVDLVLIGSTSPEPTAVGQILIARMGDAFSLCRTSRYWTIHARNATRPPACDDT